MPTLTRLLLIVALVAAAIYAAMLGLVHWVQPESHQITVRIPQHRLQQDQAPSEPIQPNVQSPVEPKGEQDAN